MSDVLVFPLEILNNGGKPNYLTNPQIQWNWSNLSKNDMSKGKERYIKNKIQNLKLPNEFKFISQSNKLFSNVIEDIIINYLL